MKMRWLRRIVQVIFLVLFVWLLFHARREPGSLPHHSSAFLRADPLAALTTSLAEGVAALSYFIPALVVLGLTLVLGRFYCGWICPLGTCIDASDRLIRRSPRAAYAPPRAWKYYLLAAVLVAAVLGTQLAWLLDPIPLLMRTFSLVFYPLVLAMRDLAVIIGPDYVPGWGAGLYPLGHQGFGQGLAVALVFLGILGLGYFSPRFWCRSLCPLGALLGLVGRFAPLRRHVGEDCTSCGWCARTCKMGAIPEETPEQTRTAECILCYNCVDCPTRSSTLSFTRRDRQQLRRGTDTRKRATLAALGLGAAYGVVAATGLARKPRHTRLIRPPGANVRDMAGNLSRMTEEEFRNRCLRCGACMRACPTGGLQPAVTEAGWDGVFTPILVPTVGWCEQHCNACGEVCPSGALQSFTIEEKSDIKLGLATINRNKCLSWRPGNEYRYCLVCDEVCSYDAVEIREIDGELRPVVVADKCTGCGICENKCPIKPGSAIVVSRSDD